MAANPIDLTTVAKVIAWLSTTTTPSSAEQGNIQDCITAASLWWLNATGRGPADGSIPTASPFVTGVAYSEIYDGNGNNELLPRNYPIQSVQSLTIGTTVVPASTAWGIYGYVIKSNGRSILLRGGSGINGTIGFAGLYTVGRSARPRFGCGDPGSDAGLVALQYTAGYSATPFDIDVAIRQLVAENYRSRNWIGQRSQSMANGAGTVVYTNWDVPPKVELVLHEYKRVAFSS